MIGVEGLSVHFNAGCAVRDAHFAIAPGDRVGVVGESGCGKSVLALSLMGMLPEIARMSGSLKIDGVEMAGSDEAAWRNLRARRLAMIFQEPMSALNPLRRVGETVMEPMRVHLGLSRADAKRKALELFEETGIPEPAQRFRQFPHELSGGQRQRVLIALALACDPDVLIADEPTTALDANVALRIITLLVELSKRRNMALLFISHDLEAVRRATTRVMIMYGGDIVEQAPTQSLLVAPAHPYARGLLAARPRFRPARQRDLRLPTIPGAVPPLKDLPAGCRFSGRCPVELAHCREQAPPRRAQGSGTVACHHTGEVLDGHARPIEKVFV